MTTRLFSIATDRPWQLTDLKLLHVHGFDGNKIHIPKTLGYFREPTLTEFPIDLSKGFRKYRKAEPTSYEQLRYLRCITQSEQDLKVGLGFDFCTNRGTLVKIMNDPCELIAIRYKGSIYLKLGTTDDYEKTNPNQKQYTYLFKLRHHLLVDQPGDLPDAKRSINRNVQNYGTFTAKLGKFRLLYTSEIIGLDNREPIGDLTDPEALKQCRFTMVRVIPKNAIDWRQNFRMKRWLLQAYLIGVKQMKLATCDFKGLVTNPIFTENCDTLMKEQSWSLDGFLFQLHQYLSHISEVMIDVDCPYTSYVFKTVNDVVYYDCHVGKNEHSFLTEEYIKLV